jgi:chemotaxis methyl-accepting protein methylase
MTGSFTPNRKAIATLTLLVTWKIWNERNAQVFHNKLAPPLVILDQVKKEARLWVCADAKSFGEIMSGE